MGRYDRAGNFHGRRILPVGRNRELRFTPRLAKLIVPRLYPHFGPFIVLAIAALGHETSFLVSTHSVENGHNFPRSRRTLANFRHRSG